MSASLPNRAIGVPSASSTLASTPTVQAANGVASVNAFSTTVHFPTHEEADRFFELIERKRSRSFWWPASDGHKGSDTSVAYVADD